MISNHMGLIPLTDIIEVIQQKDTGGLDDWGVAIYENIVTEYKCHISYNYNNEAITAVTGEAPAGTQIVYTAKIYLRGLVHLDKEDKIRFADMNDATVEYKILSVRPVRDFGGKVLATCVTI